MRDEIVEAWAKATPEGGMVAVHFKWTPDDEVEFKLTAEAAEGLKSQLEREVEAARKTATATATAVL